MAALMTNKDLSVFSSQDIVKEMNRALGHLCAHIG